MSQPMHNRYSDFEELRPTVNRSLRGVPAHRPDSRLSSRRVATGLLHGMDYVVTPLNPVKC
jgi:hypothetical protein